MSFRELHEQNTPLLLCNIWDVASAQAAEETGFSAIGTSSAAIAESLGYEDGEQMNFEQLLFIVERICASVEIPLTVDIEGGYGNSPEQVVENIISLHDLGVKGVNIEDSRVEEKRRLLPSSEFASFLQAIIEILKSAQKEIFFNVRIDTYLLNHENKLSETLKRAEQYVNAGADGIFVPGIIRADDIRLLVQKVSCPLNVMTLPGIPTFTDLSNLGVRRISMGNFLHDKTNRSLIDMLRLLNSEKSLDMLFE